MLLILGIGRLVVRPVFRYVSSLHSADLFMAVTLLIIIATAAATHAAGLSAALGAFLAGLLFAETEFRHEIEVNIEPFKGLLLGLFFMSVGMHLDLALIKAAQSVRRMRRRPDDETLERIVRAWSPWRAVGARILWHHYLSVRKKV